ncbi:MAG: tetratricopeptide repeat-containing glycosyltransferase family protein [bacterium]|nr:tetratricopeptide repeat-containing glycosyltransferase family protein [bacterium]
MAQISKRLIVRQELNAINQKDLADSLGIYMAEHYCRNKDYEKGLSEFKKIIPTLDLHERDSAIQKYINFSMQYAEEFTKVSKWAEAVEIYKDLMNYNGFPVSIFKHIGLCMKSMGNADLAIRFLKQYEEISPEKDDVYVYLADITYTDIKDNAKAIEYYEKALASNKNNYSLYNMLGHLYSTHYQDKFKDKQIEYLKKAYELAPNNRIVVKNLAYVYGKFHETQKADEFYAKLMYLNPTHSDLHSYGAYLVQHKRFSEGFKFLQHRFQKEDLKFASFPKLFENKKKRWNIKANIQGKHILVHFEQGFGDSIMFVRFLDKLKTKCGKVSLLIQEKLVKLFEDSKLDVDIYTEADIDKIKYDYYLPMMDLPIVCEVTPETIPFAKGYLKVPKTAINAYRKKYINDNNKFKIGIAFEGTMASKETDRDIPLHFLYPLMELPNVEVYSFQVDDISRQMDQIPDNLELIRLGNTFKNWEDTASAMNCMDLMVTTDNGVMNLAGALGIKTCGLFNTITEWRWFKTQGDDIAWYKSIKPYQAPTSKAWDIVVNNVVIDIKKMVSKNKKSTTGNINTKNKK